MSRKCAICGKGPSFGNTIVRRGMAKKKGGAGRRITGISKRQFRPNLKRLKATIKGSTRTIWACTKCLKSGKL